MAWFQFQEFQSNNFVFINQSFFIDKYKQDAVIYVFLTDLLQIFTGFPLNCPFEEGFKRIYR